MTRRILLADDASPVAEALRRDLEERGFAVDLAPAADVATHATPGRYGAALVGGTPRGGLVAALKGADPHLPVIALFLDRKEAGASPDARHADAVLAAPLTATGLVAVCELSARLRDLSARVADLEARASRRGGGPDLELLKRLLLAEVKRSRRYGHPLSLALVAIDGWQERAPRLSARARTAALAGVLGVVTASLRDIDVAVPFSDERVVVVMPHTKADGALRVARRLCARVREHRGQPGRTRVTASVGVATHDGDGTVSFAGLVKRAAEALARARDHGGDRAEPADPPKRRERISFG
ncbi:MAG TPA: diguanylate cyclase [Anaeromyxobacter sp.]|nr:diguanylate cyclase [Anaeromyxobacter sp.]